MGDDVVGELHHMGLENEEGNNREEGNLGAVRRELSIKSWVSVDGGQMDLRVTRGGSASYGHFSFGEMCLVYHEIRAALGVATGRQRMTKDLAKEALADLCRTALRPSALGYHVDTDTGDVFIVHFFDEHAPFCVRVSQQQLQEGRACVMGMLAKSAN